MVAIMENTPFGTFLVCVSDQQESEIALQFACLTAKKRNAKVALLHIVEPADFQGLLSISDTIRKEKEEEAQNLLNRMADMAQQYCDITPSLILREGRLGEEIINTIKECEDLMMLILGLRNDSERGPKLASRLTDKMGDEILVPVMLIPGNLTPEQIKNLV